MCVSFFVAGSHTARWRPALARGRVSPMGDSSPPCTQAGWLRSDRRREPDSSLVIEHRIVDVVLAGPDHLVGPVWRRLRHCRARRGVFGSRSMAPARVSDRIQHRDVVGAQFERSVNRPVRIDARISAVGRHDVVEVALGSAQSHCVMTTFRSIPWGRCGAGGSSPARIRSVQSANIFNTRGRTD